jgi:hypothetical protein
MHITIDNAGQFRDAMHRAGRGSQFGYEAAGLLFDFFDDVAPDMEFDAVAICCEYSEESAREIARNYGLEIDSMKEESEIQEFVINYLNQNTSVVGITSCGDIVYAQF